MLIVRAVCAVQPRHRAAPASPHGGWEKCTAPHPGNPNFEVTFFHNRATGESTYERPAEYGGDGESDSSDIYPTRSWMQQNMASMSPTAAPSGNDASMPPGATGQAAAKSPVDQVWAGAVCHTALACTAYF